MTVVAFAKNQSMNVEQSNAVEITTDPQPVGAANYAEAVLNVEALSVLVGTPTTMAVTATAEGSNDGDNWYTLSIAPSLTIVGTTAARGDVTAAFLRFKLKFEITVGTANDVASTIFDLHVNLVRK